MTNNGRAGAGARFSLMAETSRCEKLAKGVAGCVTRQRAGSGDNARCAEEGLAVRRWLDRYGGPSSSSSLYRLQIYCEQMQDATRCSADEHLEHLGRTRASPSRLHQPSHKRPCARTRNRHSRAVQHADIHPSRAAARSTRSPSHRLRHEQAQRRSEGAPKLLCMQSARTGLGVCNSQGHSLDCAATLPTMLAGCCNGRAFC